MSFVLTVLKLAGKTVELYIYEKKDHNADVICFMLRYA